MTFARPLVLLALGIGVLTPLPAVAPATAQTSPPAAQSSASLAKRAVLLAALVRQARVAQRDCDVAAKRIAVNSIQMALREVRSTMRREVLQIAADVRHLRRDGIDLAEVAQLRNAVDAIPIVTRRMETARTPQIRARLATLRDRYHDFDQWEVFYNKVTRMLARLDGLNGNCQAAAARPAASEPPGIACPPEQFEACRYGRPTGGNVGGLTVLVPMKKQQTGNR